MRISADASERPCRQATSNETSSGSSSAATSSGGCGRRLRGTSGLGRRHEDALGHAPHFDAVASRERAARERIARPTIAEADGEDAPAEQVERRIDLQHPGADIDGPGDEEED